LGVGLVTQTVKEQISIPKGVESGTILKFINLGHFEDSSKIGELWVSLTVIKEEGFERYGVDLKTKVKVGLLQAALGDRVEIESVMGKWRMVVPQGTNHGDDIRIPNLGVANPYQFGKKRGDLVVNVSLEVPTDLDDELKEIMREYAKIENSSKKNYVPIDK
jgi:molecular chaperone DnaJ